MKRLFTIILSSIAYLSLWGSVPMTIAGDVYNIGEVKSEGAMHVKAVSSDYVGRVANYGNLDLDSVIFYSDSLREGLLMNKNTVSTNGIVIVRKNFKNDIFYMMAFPFDVVLASGIKNPLNGSTPQIGGNVDDPMTIKYYDGQKRAEEGKNVDDIWVNLPGTETELKKGTGYWIAVTPSLAAPGTYLTEGANMDFIAKDTTGLFNTTDNKGVNLDYPHTSPPYFLDTNSDGWNARGGLHTCNYYIDAGTVNYDRTVYFRDVDMTWGEFEPNARTGTLRPYAVLFVKTDETSNLSFDLPSGLGGFQYLSGNGVSLDIADPSIVFRSAGDEITHVIANKNVTNKPVYRTSNAYDFLELQLTDSKNNVAYSYFKFNNSYSKIFKSSEDDIKLQTTHPVKPVVWSLAQNENDVKQILFVDCLPFGKNEVTLGYSVVNNDNYVFSMREITNETISNAVLYDKVANKYTDLLKNDYSFSSGSVTNNEDRFLITFNDNSFTSIEPSPATSGIYAYVEDNVLNVKNLVSGDKIQVIDLTGRIIASDTVSGNTFSTTLKQKGVYIISVKGEKTLKILNK